MLKLDEYLTAHVLKAKYEDHNGAAFLRHMLETAKDPVTGLKKHTEEQIDEQLGVSQVCAKIPRYYVEQLDGVCGFLGVQKREFIEQAIVHALNSAMECLHHFDAIEETKKTGADL
jgi:hypothetical protein